MNFTPPMACCSKSLTLTPIVSVSLITSEEISSINEKGPREWTDISFTFSCDLGEAY